MRMSLCPNVGGDADQYRGGESDLLGPGPHLPSLPLEPPHTLLSPLGPHVLRACLILKWRIVQAGRLDEWRGL